MFNRPLLKSRAKAVLGTCYWRAVAISVVVSIISSLAGGLFRIRVSDTIMLGSPFRTALFLLTTGCFFVLNLAISVFLLQPLSLGIYKFHLDSADGKFSDTYLWFPRKLQKHRGGIVHARNSAAIARYSPVRTLCSEHYGLGYAAQLCRHRTAEYFADRA